MTTPTEYEQMSEADQLREAVIDLFNGMSPGGGWIPGGAYAELAEVLGVSPDRLIHYDHENKRRVGPPEHPFFTGTDSVMVKDGNNPEFTCAVYVNGVVCGKTYEEHR